jgi:hypothetical protein
LISKLLAANKNHGSQYKKCGKKKFHP